MDKNGTELTYLGDYYGLEFGGIPTKKKKLWFKKKDSYFISYASPQSLRSDTGETNPEFANIMDGDEDIVLTLKKTETFKNPPVYLETTDPPPIWQRINVVIPPGTAPNCTIGPYQGVTVTFNFIPPGGSYNTVESMGLYPVPTVNYLSEVVQRPDVGPYAAFIICFTFEDRDWTLADTLTIDGYLRFA